jgi:PrsW family intramembrane metalloprotease
VDYLKYPALSAMGFATVENMLYASRYGVDVLQIRGILCVSGHIFYSALAGYFFWLGRTRGGLILAFPSLLVGFGLGVLAHGLYDYFLFENEFQHNSFIGVFSVVLCGGFMYIFNKMLIHSLRESHFFNPRYLNVIYSAGFHLFAGLVFVFLFIGIALAFQSGNMPTALAYWWQNGIQALLGTVVLTSLLALDRKDFQAKSQK